MRTVAIVFLFLLSTNGDYFGVAHSGEPSSDTDGVVKQELIDRIQSQLDVCFPANATELVVTGGVSQQYGDVVVLVSKSSLRYILDRSTEKVFLGYSYSPQVIDKHRAAPAEYGAAEIKGGMTKKFSTSAGGWTSADFGSFAKAIRAIDVPIPFFHAILDFPSHNSVDGELKGVMDLITDEKASIQFSSDDRRFTYTLRIEHEPTRFDRWIWEFDSQTGVLLLRSIDRAIDSKYRRYYEFILNWEKSPSGDPQLRDVMSSQLVIRDQEGFAGGRQLGTETRTWEFSYRDLDSNKLDLFQASMIRKPADLVEFIANSARK